MFLPLPLATQRLHRLFLPLSLVTQRLHSQLQAERDPGHKGPANEQRLYFYTTTTDTNSPAAFLFADERSVSLANIAFSLYLFEQLQGSSLTLSFSLVIVEGGSFSSHSYELHGFTARRSLKSCHYSWTRVLSLVLSFLQGRT